MSLDLFDVGVLAPLGAATQKDYGLPAVAAIIEAVPWAIVDPEFHDALADALVITEGAAFNPAKTLRDPYLNSCVDTIHPVIEGYVAPFRLELLDSNDLLLLLSRSPLDQASPRLPMYTLVYISFGHVNLSYDANRDMVTGVYSSGACVTTSSGSMP